VTRVIAGQDSGLMINPDGVRHQIKGNVIQSTSRALMEEARNFARCRLHRPQSSRSRKTIQKAPNPTRTS
jgi:CO/xanthine dehydrogenase Mo-binding subunit